MALLRGARGSWRLDILEADKKTMKFQFNELRATQAAAVLLVMNDGCMSVTRLLLMLYLADRKALAEVGEPIAGARFYNTTTGPSCRELYECVNGNCPSMIWSRYIGCHVEQLDRCCVQLNYDPGDGELSEYDVETLALVFETHRGKTHSELIRFARELGEWRNPVDAASDTLKPETIMRTQGVNARSIALFDARNRAIRAVEDFINRPGVPVEATET